MANIYLSIDDTTKDKLEKLAKQKGYKDINTFIVETIKKEIHLEDISITYQDTILQDTLNLSSLLYIIDKFVFNSRGI